MANRWPAATPSTMTNGDDEGVVLSTATFGFHGFDEFGGKMKRSIDGILILAKQFFVLEELPDCWMNLQHLSGPEVSEREALLRFKQDLKDPANRLALWSDGNCCTWAGVVCNES
ncbi:hypothetical protein CUMW_240310 [Citrus unshiu]|uniref:Leucine-rich repeat-containing N-terminal plant-type domain-containing protein n=1 Tax=Citrus unshiu TaxID=55188 RepID=A0A2H5QL28_CITUN|nr:hypothetical protein CUMW_240310 [Citrus unshiu]